MFTIAESINIMSKTIGPAIRNRDKGPVQKMAIEQAEAGADMLDLNLGPARKNGDEMMEWLVKTVQEVVKTPLALDTMNAAALEAGLKVCKNEALLNSISAQPESLSVKLPLAKKYDVDFVALTLSDEGIPRDVNERAVCLVTIMTAAAELDIPTSRMWVDGIALPISVDLNQVLSLQEFMIMLPEIIPDCKSTCGLSNVSNGTPDELRGIINRTYMMMLEKLGMYSAIVDVYDKELMDIASGKDTAIKELVSKVMDGGSVDMGSLSPREIDYVKTVKVLLGDSLYSHSWLEI
jgi:5-methyltetrahydrofolate corrinoid/iron sulfur protein methyltransferase